MSYSSGFVFGDVSATTQSCLKPVEPVVYQLPSVPVAAGEQTALTDLLVLAAGDPMGYGGQVDNRSNCFGLLLTITYWVGADCSPCTLLPLTSVVKSIFVKAGDVFNLPAGYWSTIQYQTADDDGAVVASPVDGKFRFYSSYTPNCPSCAVLVGDTVEPTWNTKSGKKETIVSETEKK